MLLLLLCISLKYHTVTDLQFAIQVCHAGHATKEAASLSRVWYAPGRLAVAGFDACLSADFRLLPCVAALCRPGTRAPADVHIMATQSTCDKSCPCSAGGLTCRTGFLQQAVGCYCLCWQQTVGSRSGTQHISLELLSGSLQLHQHTTIGPQKLLVTILGCCVHAFW